MKTRILTLLVATTALTAAIGASARSAVQAPAEGRAQPFAALLEAGEKAMPLVFVSNKDNEDDDRYREGTRRGHDDDDDDGCEDEGDDDCRGSAGNPAPAGTVEPPQNGLFENGALPQTQTN